MTDPRCWPQARAGQNGRPDGFRPAGLGPVGHSEQRNGGCRDIPLFIYSYLLISPLWARSCMGIRELVK